MLHKSPVMCVIVKQNTTLEKTRAFVVRDTSLSLSLSAVTHAPFHAPVLRPTSWPNARDRRDGEVN